MDMIWFTSDLHFNHNKDFIYGPRGFSSIEEHDEEIIKRWNKVVESDDTVFVLGDLLLNDKKDDDAIKNTIDRLEGNIIIVPGNHDTSRRVDRYVYEACSVIKVCPPADILKYKKYQFYLSHYPACTTNFDDDKRFSGRLFSLSGHTHSKELFDEKTGSYNVAVDAHNCYPVSIETIIKDLKEYVRKDTL